MARPARFCWANMFLSAVISRSNLPFISESSRPFLIFLQPVSLSLTDLTPTHARSGVPRPDLPPGRIGFAADRLYHPPLSAPPVPSPKATPMSDTPPPDTPPDRLSNNPKSPFYDAALLERGIGIRFKGVEKTNVEEYCVSEGWVRVAVGKTVDRHGAPLTMKLSGPVEPYFRDAPPTD
jgi:hypothetical protein